jgi:hypothetical protein
MSLYLETNTVRSLARWIRRADTYSVGDSFTSFLVIFELLSGTTEEDFAHGVLCLVFGKRGAVILKYVS